MSNIAIKNDLPKTIFGQGVKLTFRKPFSQKKVLPLYRTVSMDPGPHARVGPPLVLRGTSSVCTPLFHSSYTPPSNCLTRWSTRRSISPPYRSLIRWFRPRRIRWTAAACVLHLPLFRGGVRTTASPTTNHCRRPGRARLSTAATDTFVG